MSLPNFAEMDPSELIALHRDIERAAWERNIALPIGAATLASRETSAATPYVAEDPITFAMFGLGRMGAKIGERAIKGGHRVIGYDKNEDVVSSFAANGDRFEGAAFIEEALSRLPRPRYAWMMLPAGDVTDKTIKKVASFMEDGDVIIDGSNGHYRDDMARASQLAEQGIHLVDAGTSGGVWGLKRGYSLMLGGDKQTVDSLNPLWKTLAPGVNAAERTHGRVGPVTNAEKGFLHCGTSGAGHMIKMIHNGIEYGQMAALAEGISMIERIRLINQGDEAGEKVRKELTIGSTDLSEFYDFDSLAPTTDIIELWRRGSVVASWLLDLTVAQMLKSPDMVKFSAKVSDSGEGRWMAQAAIDLAHPVPVLNAALAMRFGSRGNDVLTRKVLSAQRNGFGGHEEE